MSRNILSPSDCLFIHGVFFFVVVLFLCFCCCLQFHFSYIGLWTLVTVVVSRWCWPDFATTTKTLKWMIQYLNRHDDAHVFLFSTVFFSFRVFVFVLSVLFCLWAISISVYCLWTLRRTQIMSRPSNQSNWPLLAKNNEIDPILGRSWWIKIFRTRHYYMDERVNSYRYDDQRIHFMLNHKLIYIRWTADNTAKQVIKVRCAMRIPQTGRVIVHRRHKSLVAKLIKFNLVKTLRHSITSVGSNGICADFNAINIHWLHFIKRWHRLSQQ